MERNIPEKLKWKEIYLKNWNGKKYTSKFKMERNILEKLKWKDIILEKLK